MMRFKEFTDLPTLSNIAVEWTDTKDVEALNEGRKWVKGRFDRSLGIDQPTHGAGERHAHIYGRKGDEIGCITVSGGLSHGYTKVQLDPADADALRRQNFNIPKSNIVEWLSLGQWRGTTLLLG